jgi:hypothetical protein
LIGTDISIIHLDYEHFRLYISDSISTKVGDSTVPIYEDDRLQAIVYTANIFFRLTLKLENFKYERRGLAVYVFVVYLLGIVCLAYIADLMMIIESHQFSANLRLLKSVQNRSRLKLLLRMLISPHVASLVLSTVVRPAVYRRLTPSPIGL